MLTGGKGADTLIGGGTDGGTDTFFFAALSDSTVSAKGRDTIVDFEQGHYKIDVSEIDAIKGGSDDGFTFIGEDKFHHVAGELRESIQGGNTIVSGDVNGDGHADFAIKLDGHVLLQGTDFGL